MTSKYRQFSEAAKNKREQDLKNGTIAGASVAGIAGGANLVDNVSRNGLVDGRVNLFHNTEKKNVKNILQDGLIARLSNDPNSITQEVAAPIGKFHGMKPEDYHNKVYLGRKKGVANGVGLGRMQRGGTVGKTLKASIPYQEYKNLKFTDNPELLKAKTKEEYAEKVIQYMNAKSPVSIQKGGYQEKVLKDMLNNAYKTLGEDTATIADDFDAKYFKDSDKYVKNSFREVGNYIKENPKRFAKGVGLGTLGVGALGAGSYGLYNAYKSNKGNQENFNNRLKEIRNSKEANEMDYNDYLEKMAGYSYLDHKSRDEDMDTRVWRDRIKPEFKRNFKAIPAFLGGAVLGTGLEMARTKGNPSVNIPGVLGGAAGLALSKRKQRKEAYTELNDRYENPISQKDIKSNMIGGGVADVLSVSPLPPVSLAGGIANVVTTPEAAIQKARREREFSSGATKEAYEIVDIAFFKCASER